MKLQISEKKLATEQRRIKNPAKYDGAFCKNSEWILVINYFWEKTSSQTFDRLLNTPLHQVRNYMFKFNDRNTRTRGEICSKLTIKTLERRH